MLGYSMARPAVESLFLTVYSSALLPWVWIAVAVGTGGSVLLYWHAAAGKTLVTIYVQTTIVAALILLLLIAGCSLKIPGSVFLLYIWKDIYVIILVEIFWTIANHIFSLRSAERLYGLFLGVGSIGSIAGNMLVGPIATTFGSSMVLWVVLGSLIIMLAPVPWLSGTIQARLDSAAKSSISYAEGFKLLWQSRTIFLLNILIASSQIVITLIDYVYNLALETRYPDTDIRTAIGGNIYAWVNGLAFLLQFLTKPLLQSLGAGRVLVTIALTLIIIFGGFLLSSQFLGIAVAKIASKCFDYSIFRSAKEILYIPLNYTEKTLGKAFVDMFTYRFAKGAASAMLLVVTVVSKSLIANVLVVMFLGLWIGVSRALSKRHNTALQVLGKES